MSRPILLCACVTALALVSALRAQNYTITVGTGLSASNNVTLTDGSWTVSTSISRFTITNGGTDLNPVTAFCIELENSISNNTTEAFFRTTDAALAGRGTANAGTAPTFGLAGGLGAAGGIGSTRASYIHALIFQNYDPNPNSTWWTESLSFVNVPDQTGATANITVPNARTYAMQIAIWELAYDATPGFVSGSTPTNWGWNGSLINGNPNATGLGTFRVETSANSGFTPAGGAAGNGRALNAVKALAQVFINQAVANPRSSGAYVFLSDSYAAGTGTRQDLVSGIPSLIPEPSTWAALSGVAALALALIRRKVRSAAR